MSDEDRLRLELGRVVAGRPLSIVGNATSLLASTHGALIDSGCVLRMNAGIPINRKAQGRRTDIHCFSTMPALQMNLGSAKGRWLRWRNAGSFHNALRIWMHPENRDLCEDPEQLFYPEWRWRQLADILHAPPSVGAMALDMVAMFAGQTDVRIFGFDFKSSTTFYRKRDKKGHHDWSAERQFALALTQERGWNLV
ncbi:hypothetical protein [Mesorhizobium sp. KR9-304]|uniref:hypothetical protein n=1 Tax=Mesorhizobium sp. KR9-304 TaxID=3156614 RepID=UPI0032B39212